MAQSDDCITNGVLALLAGMTFHISTSYLGFFLFDLLNRLFKRRDEHLGVSQIVLGQPEFRDQHPVFVHKDQAITLLHGDLPSTIQLSDAVHQQRPLAGSRHSPFSYSQEVWNQPPPISYNLIRLNR